MLLHHDLIRCGVKETSTHLNSSASLRNPTSFQAASSAHQMKIFSKQSQHPRLGQNHHFLSDSSKHGGYYTISTQNPYARRQEHSYLLCASTLTRWRRADRRYPSSSSQRRVQSRQGGTKCFPYSWHKIDGCLSLRLLALGSHSQTSYRTT